MALLKNFQSNTVKEEVRYVVGSAKSSETYTESSSLKSASNSFMSFSKSLKASRVKKWSKYPLGRVDDSSYISKSSSESERVDATTDLPVG